MECLQFEWVSIFGGNCCGCFATELKGKREKVANRHLCHSVSATEKAIYTIRVAKEKKEACNGLLKS